MSVSLSNNPQLWFGQMKLKLTDLRVEIFWLTGCFSCLLPLSLDSSIPDAITDKVSEEFIPALRA